MVQQMKLIESAQAAKKLGISRNRLLQILREASHNKGTAIGEQLPSGAWILHGEPDLALVEDWIEAHPPGRRPVLSH